MEEDEIINFWNWFIQNTQRIEQGIGNDSLTTEIDNKIIELGNDFSWEIGPGLIQKYFLAISPNFNKALLKETYKIISKAPELKGWEFHPALPRKKWNLFWKMHDSNQRIIEVDANNWEYVLYQYEDGVLDIEVLPQNWNRPHDQTLDLAVEIAILGEIGERTYIEKINTYEAVKSFNPDVKKNASLFKNLNKNIIEIGLSMN